MFKGILGVLILVMALSLSSIVLAEETKAPVLTAITVAVDGLHCQGCVDELQLDLGKEAGVTEVVVTMNPGQVTAKLDESKTSASKLVNVIAAHPQAMDKTKNYGAKLVVFTAVTVAVDGLHCQGCVDELQLDLGKVDGVSEVVVTMNPGQVTAKLDESKTSASKLVNVIAAHPQAMDKTKTYGAKLVAYIDTEMCAKNKKMCAGCFTEIPKVLNAIKGVSEVTLDETGKIATISFAKEPEVSTSALAKALGASDYMFKVAFTAPKPVTTK